MPDMYDESVERRRNRGFLGFDSSALPPRDRQDRHQLRYEIDLNGMNMRIWAVAASGFLTDSYNLFASNVVNAMLAFVYYPYSNWCGMLINVFTLLGSVCGQLLFGYLADRYGRTRLYGIELILVIVSTIGVATSSSGYGGGGGDMSFLALFIWWRFVMGIGIGAEYPLSAVITSEWSSTSSRGAMISAVFLMQPVGQALAQLVGVWVLLSQDAQWGISAKQCGINSYYDEDCKKIIDGVWRIVIGSGAVPALLAIIFRFFLYDCGLYTLEVKNKPGMAFRDTQRIYGPPPATNGITLGSPDGSMYSAQPMPVQFSWEDLKTFLIKDKNWYYLLGTAATWFFLDISFYGSSLDSQGTLADLWATKSATPLNSQLSCWNYPNSTLPSWAANGTLPGWQTDSTQPCNNIYQTLLEQAKQYLLTVSVPSIAGSGCFIFAANRLPRRQWLTVSFMFLTLLFTITGGVYYATAHSPGAPATVVLVAICHFVFNFGANTLTFIIPAEVFPTCYRCTCHGISAAAGKIGSIVAVLVFYAIDVGYNSPKKPGLAFILFGSLMAFGALFAWAYLPDVQRVVVEENARGRLVRRLEAKNLEELGEGRERARLEGQLVTVRDKWAEIKRRGRRRLSSVTSSVG